MGHYVIIKNVWSVKRFLNLGMFEIDLAIVSIVSKFVSNFLSIIIQVLLYTHEKHAKLRSEPSKMARYLSQTMHGYFKKKKNNNF